MQETEIAWTDETWNPVHGCSKVSAGCDNCYAERISRQYGHTENPWTNEFAEENVSLRPDKLDEPLSIDEGTRIFVNSMSDLFHSHVPDEFVERVLEVARETPRHIYQILTKRPGRAAHMDVEWPENVWLGTSVEDERVVERIDMLCKADASTLFVSFEPLIGSVGEVDLTGIDWVIVGGESGPDYRTMEHAWARKILDTARRDDAAFFFKQSAARQPERGQELTVERSDGVMTQKEIRELPELPQVTIEARSEKTEQATLTDGGFDLDESERSASLSDYGISPDPKDGMQCTGITRNGSRHSTVIEYTADRLLCPACQHRERLDSDHSEDDLITDGGHSVDHTEHARFRDRDKAVEAARQSGKTERKAIECPQCGGEFANLPNHLVGCDGKRSGDTVTGQGGESE